MRTYFKHKNKTFWFKSYANVETYSNILLDQQKWGKLKICFHDFLEQIFLFPWTNAFHIYCEWMQFQKVLHFNPFFCQKFIYNWNKFPQRIVALSAVRMQSKCWIACGRWPRKMERLSYFEVIGSNMRWPTYAIHIVPWKWENLMKKFKPFPEISSEFFTQIANNVVNASDVVNSSCIATKIHKPSHWVSI